ncbi:MAG: phosphoribosylglycinamide formyltransferase [Clostridia bacterium]|nr:phosphoribosylglycinamide formyltransferase [Clostridia bacterium]
MNKTRIAVMVSGGGTNLQALIDAEREGRIKSGEIVLVVSSSAEAFAVKRAENAGIPAAIIPRRQCSSQEEFEERIVSKLREYAVELIVLAGFMSILSEDFVRKYPKRIINVHPSLIPSFCGKGFYGLHVHEAALKYGVKVTGATVHYVNEIADGGEIIMQKAVSVCDGDTPESLQMRVMRLAEWRILPAATEKVAAKIMKEKMEKKNERI